MMSSDRVFCTLPVHTFTRKRHRDAASATFTAFPVGVHFRGLLKQKSDKILPWISNQDLFSTVIALYDVCLPNIGVENVRTHVFERGAKTILLLRDQQEVLKEYQDKQWPEVDVPIKSSAHEASDDDERSGTFSAVFSDPESSEEEEDSDEEESERFRTSMEGFLTAVTARRQQRRRHNPTPDTIGIECCLVAALTYKKSALKAKEKIIELSLLSTRRRYRHCGAAKHMIKLLKDVSLVGFYDAIVTHADSNAIELFASCGFSDDVILNNRFRNLEHNWMYTTTMSYFPPFSTGPNTRLDIGDLKAEMTKWRDKSLAAHEAQSIFLDRILNEIQTLRKQVTSQKKEIHKLTADLEEEREERKDLQKELHEYQVKEIEPVLGAVHLNPGGDKEDKDPGTWQTQDLVHRSFHIDGCQLELQEIVQAALSWQITEDIKAYVSTLPACQRLYYCGGWSRPERLMEILHSGFSPRDIQQGELGTGLYFSASPACAITQLPPYNVLVADVYLEKTKSVGVMTTYRTSSSSSSGCDAVLVPGAATGSVIFSHLQAVPVCLLKYTKREFPGAEHA